MEKIKMKLLDKTISIIKKPATVWTFTSVCGAGIVLLSVFIIVALIPTSTPDVWGDDIPEVANFFMDKDFNKLPPRERLGLLTEFIKRFKEFDQDDAVMMAQILSDMNLELRKQIEDNMRQLAIDIMTESASEYALLDPSEKEDYLDKFLLDFDKMADDINGRLSDKTDEERLQDINRHAQRDVNRERDRSTPIRGEGIKQFFKLYNESFEAAGAVQRGEVARFVLDLARYTRGEDDSGG